MLAVVLFAWSDLSWWWFAVLLLAPDLSMVGYLKDATGRSRRLQPRTLVVVARAAPGRRNPDAVVPLLIGAGSIWLAHIGMDRALGYGLKLEDGFTHTHLGLIGRRV